MKYIILLATFVASLAANAQFTGDVFTLTRVDQNVSTLVVSGFAGVKANHGARFGVGFLKQTILPHETARYTDYSCVTLQYRQTFENGNFFYIGPAFTRLGYIDVPTTYSYGFEVGAFLLKI